MGTVDVWSTIHAERAALADDLGALTDQQWDTPSLCAGWTVRDVLAHMTSTARTTALSFLPNLAKAGFNFNKMSEREIAAVKGATPADTLAAFKSEISSSKAPPGPKDTWLGEMIIHGEDIRRPLGISHDYPKDAVVEVADFFKGSNLIIGAKKRIAGLRLRATDADWTHGDGPEVAGPILSLVMAMTGRKPAIDELSGDGVEALRSRS